MQVGVPVPHPPLRTGHAELFNRNANRYTSVAAGAGGAIDDVVRTSEPGLRELIMKALRLGTVEFGKQVALDLAANIGTRHRAGPIEHKRRFGGLGRHGAIRAQSLKSVDCIGFHDVVQNRAPVN